jgi:hypothetical protein
MGAMLNFFVRVVVPALQSREAFRLGVVAGVSEFKTMG